MVFHRKQEPTIVSAPPPPQEPTIIDKIEADLKQKESVIQLRENELATLNAEAAALSSQLAWLKRTPQAVVILTLLHKKFGGAV